MARLTRRIEQAAKPVPVKPEDAVRRRPEGSLPKPIAPPVDVDGGEERIENTRKTSEFTTIEVTTSKGKKQRIVIPASYAERIPKVWSWNRERYDAAQYIAEGYPVSQVCDMLGIGSRMTIYGWLEHPEFREHVDTLISETSYASQRERVSGLSRLTKMLFDKLANEIDSVRITDKSMGAIINGIQGGLKQLAQEKGEFIEQQSIQQQTNISGNLGVAKLDLNELMKTKTSEERAELEAEFDAIGEELIRSMTGAKE